MPKAQLLIDGEVKHTEEIEMIDPEYVAGLENTVTLLQYENTQKEEALTHIVDMAKSVMEDTIDPVDNVLFVSPGESIMEAVLSASEGQVVQIQEGRYHEQIDLSGIKNIRIEGSGVVVIDGRHGVDWIWSNSVGLHTAIYPGFEDLWHFRGNHEGDTFNNRLMYPLLCTIGDDPLTYNPDGITALQEGEFYVDSEPDKVGTITVKLKPGQSIDDFMVSPFDRLLWGDDNCTGIELINIQFKGCSGPGKTGALNFPGTEWLVEDVSIDLASIVGIELGQGGDRQDMRGHVTHSIFRRVFSYRAGQQGWWGSAANCILEDCGHEGSNRRGFDHWWEASHKFENMHFCMLIRWTARNNNGPGLWFDGVYKDGLGGNTFNEIIDPYIENCIRTGIELELGTSNNTITNPTIKGITAKTIHPEKTWGQAVAIMVKAFSSGNKVIGGTVDGCEHVALVDNTDGRGVSDKNTFEGITHSNIKSKPFQHYGELLGNVFPN